MECKYRILNEYQSLLFQKNVLNKNKSAVNLYCTFYCDEGGIRTRGTPFRVRRFSKPVVSATHPPHHHLLRHFFRGCKYRKAISKSKAILGNYFS